MAAGAMGAGAIEGSSSTRAQAVDAGSGGSRAPATKSGMMKLELITGRSVSTGKTAASIQIRSSEENGAPPPPPSPLAIRTIQIMSHRVRKPMPPSEVDAIVGGGGDESNGGLVRRLKQRRREARPFIVYVLKVSLSVCWAEDSSISTDVSMTYI